MDMTQIETKGCDSYADFLSSKRVAASPRGFRVEPDDLNPKLWDWQRQIVSWALGLGCAALFEDCGLGKGPQQLEWARQVALHTGLPVLIVAPLTVAQQFVSEATKFDVPITLCLSQSDVRPGVNVTNYERLHLFDGDAFGGVSLDESSILKNFVGKTKTQLIEMFARTPFKLCNTATPAPNDYLELGNHAEFLGIMPANQMLMRWFINNLGEAGDYRLKEHARKDFFRWVASWAVCIETPADLGYPADGYILPELHIMTETVDIDWTVDAEEGQLLRSPSISATTRHREGRLTIEDRARKVAEIVRREGTGSPWVIWCSTDYEADTIRKHLPTVVEVRGSEKPDVKSRKLTAFTNGEIDQLLTKASIAGYGLNWQHCWRHICLTNYSYEDFYQMIRRSYRFGQKHDVYAYIVTAESETAILQAVREKQAQHEDFRKGMREAMSETGLHAGGGHKALTVVEHESRSGDGWKIWLGDSCETIKNVTSNSVGLSVFSPPFANLYIYSDAEADMGNCADDDEFEEHFRFLIPELARITIPGRLCAVHCKDLPTYKNRDGASGLNDFPGRIIRAFLGDEYEDLMRARRIMERLRCDVSDIDEALVKLGGTSTGWAFHSRVTIWKDPVTEMQRTKNHGLLYKELCKDSSVSRQGMADFVIVFRKWDGGDFTDPVTQGKERFTEYVGIEPPDANHTADRFGLPRVAQNKYGRWPRINPFPCGDPNAPNGSLAWRQHQAHREWSINVWQKYASPVWFDIDQMNVLNNKAARGDRDEKHICPLQLDVIGRLVHLYTNPGDLVYSPFAGIGSEGDQSIKLGRRFEGGELKREYWQWACEHLAEIEGRMKSVTLLDLMADDANFTLEAA